jgi:hypothetical protein
MINLVKIFTGWLHSGYPIMAYTSIVPGVLSLANQKTNGAWGFTHELGHNHQWGSWSVPAMGETACNWWSIYVNKEVGFNFNLYILN